MGPTAVLWPGSVQCVYWRFCVETAAGNRVDESCETEPNKLLAINPKQLKECSKRC